MLNENGRRYADLVTMEAVSRPLIVHLDHGDQPPVCHLPLADAFKMTRRPDDLVLLLDNPGPLEEEVHTQ